jgi:hypothetical protein
MCIQTPELPNLSADAATEGTLHVIFHGTFLFHYDRNNLRNGQPYIEVLIPRVEDHVLRIGNWLAEIDLSGHRSVPTFELSGVRPGGECNGNVSHNLVFDGLPLKPRDQLEQLLVARLLLPLPRLIRSPRRSPAGPEHFSDPALLPDDLREIATLQIFTYEIQKESELAIHSLEAPGMAATSTQSPAGHHGQPVLWEPAFSDASFNLHIFAAPEQDRPAMHVSNAFSRLMGLFDGSMGRLSMVQFPPLSILDVSELGAVPGILVEETEDLAPRRRRLSQLGRMRKERRDLNLTWFSTEAFDDDPGSCAGVYNGRG